MQRGYALPVDEMAVQHLMSAQNLAGTGDPKSITPDQRGRQHISNPKSIRHNIPADVTSFVGRSQEVRDIRTLLRKTRLLTLTGTGGVGKSRTARSAGAAIQRAFKDGVWLTDFDFVQDSRFVQQAIQDSTPGPASVLSLADQLADRSHLLILDNCDRLTEEIADTVAGLLARCPQLRILATSRTPLDISAEYVLNIQPFIADADGHSRSDLIDDAVRLFRDRAQAASGWCQDARADLEIAQLCRQLDGLPLAIELAALRTRTMPVQEIIKRLDDRFGLLKGGPRDMHPRHRSLWTLLEWTWDQCSVAERSLWAQFSVFVGSATLDAIRAVCVTDDSSDITDVVDDLVQQSILTRRQSGDRIRFQMLDTIRAFGRLKLERDSTSLGFTATLADLRNRHLDYYAAFTKGVERAWFGPDQLHTSVMVTDEMANMRAAFDWAMEFAERGSIGTTMVADLWFYWNGCGHLNEGRLWSEHAWDQVERLGIAHDANELWVLGWNLLITGDVDRAEHMLLECFSQAERQGDARAASFGRALLGAVRFFQDDYAAGIELYVAAVGEAKRRGDQLSSAVFLYQLAEAYCLSDQFELAEECCRECIAICERNGDQWCISYARWVQALRAYMQRSDDRAASIAAQALTTMRTIDDQLGIALAGEVCAWLAAENGKYRDAATILGATESYWTASGSSVMGLRRLMEMRAACEAKLKANLAERDLTRAIAKGRTLGFDWIAPLALQSAGETGVADSPVSSARLSVDRDQVSTAQRNSAALQSLTRREREIANLVAQGLTNKEIAAQLIIGKRTADTHVAHVLAKCGLRRRSEIASLIASSAQTP